jgi:hypothetical protein
MPLDYKFINPITTPQWDHLIAESENYSIFHSSLWAKTLVDSYGFVPFYYIGKIDDKLAVAVPLMEVQDIFGRKKGISLPFSDFCTPIFRDKITFDATFDSIIELAKRRKWRSITVRGNAPLSIDENKSSFFFRHIIPLQSDEKTLFANLKGKTRTDIRKAVKSGVTVSFETSFNAMVMFCQLNCRTRKRHGLPPQPFSFFKNIFNNLIASGHGEIALVKYNGQTICSDIFLHSGTTAYYKYGASNEMYNNTRSNYLILWEAIKKYNDLGYKRLCLGRTEPNHIGLLQFKSGWGAEQFVIRSFTFDVVRDEFIKTDLKTTGFYNSIFSRMPITFLKLLGKLLYKYMG